MNIGVLVGLTFLRSAAYCAAALAHHCAEEGGVVFIFRRGP